MKLAAGSRIFAGVLVSAAGAWALGNAISRIVRRLRHRIPDEVYLIDGPPPLDFTNYAPHCTFGLVTIVAGWMIIRRRWLELSLCCWFFLTLLLLEGLYSSVAFGWPALLPGSADLIVMIPLAATVAACWRTTARRQPSQEPQSAMTSEIILALAIAAGLVVRSAAYLLSPEGPTILAYLRGEGVEAGGYVLSAVDCIVGPVLAGMLAWTAMTLRHGYLTPFLTLLTIIATMTLGSFWMLLDSAWDPGRPHPPTTLHAAVLFAVSGVALVVSLHRRHVLER